MAVVTRTALLLLAVVCTEAAGTTDNCEFQSKRLQKNDLPSIFGNWALVWAVSANPNGQMLLSRVNSSRIELSLADDNNTILLIEKNMYSDGACEIYHLNLSMPTDLDHHSLQISGQSSPLNNSSEAVFYKSCPDCMQLVYNSTAMCPYLLSYRREGQHRDVEQVKAVEADHKKMAECLGFPHDNPFVYDGFSDFCHKESAPAFNAQES